jgi:predicted GNAT family acetyltransferase
MAGTLRDNSTLNRYELDADGHTALLYYRIEPGVITLMHTEVPPELGGRGIGSTLVRNVLDAIRARGLKVIAKCPFVGAFIGKHPEYNDLLR